MTWSPTQTDAVAQAFVGARAAARPLDVFPGSVPETLDDAVAVQERAILLGGRSVVGWKVAMIRPDLRDPLGSERIAGPIMAGTVALLLDGGSAEVAVYEGGFAALEAEFVARFATAVHPGPDGFTPAVIRAALGSLHAGAEVASSPLATINDLGPLAVVSDHGNNAGVVVGPELTGWRDADPSTLTSRMRVDGVVVGEGSAANVPGGPIASLVWLAGHLARRGRRLRAGDVVATGMTTGIHRVGPGSTGRIEFLGATPCDIRVVAARPGVGLGGMSEG